MTLKEIAQLFFIKKTSTGNQAERTASAVSTRDKDLLKAQERIGVHPAGKPWKI